MSVVVDIQDISGPTIFSVNVSTSIDYCLIKERLNCNLDCIDPPIKVDFLPTSKEGRSVLPRVRTFKVYSNSETLGDNSGECNFYTVCNRETLIEEFSKLYVGLGGTLPDANSQIGHKASVHTTSSTSINNELLSENLPIAPILSSGNEFLREGNKVPHSPMEEEKFTPTKKEIEEPSVPDSAADDTTANSSSYEGSFTVPTDEMIEKLYKKLEKLQDMYDQSPTADHFRNATKTLLANYQSSPCFAQMVEKHFDYLGVAKWNHDSIMFLLTYFFNSKHDSFTAEGFLFLLAKTSGTKAALIVGTYWYRVAFRQRNSCEGILDRAAMMKVAHCSAKHLNVLYQLSGLYPKGYHGKCENCKMVNSHASKECIRFFTHDMRIDVLEKEMLESNCVACIGCGDRNCSVKANASHRYPNRRLDWCDECGRNAIAQNYHVKHLCPNPIVWDARRTLFNQMAALYQAISTMSTSEMENIVYEVSQKKD